MALPMLLLATPSPARWRWLKSITNFQRQPSLVQQATLVVQIAEHTRCQVYMHLRKFGVKLRPISNASFRVRVCSKIRVDSGWTSHTWNSALDFSSLSSIVFWYGWFVFSAFCLLETQIDLNICIHFIQFSYEVISRHSLTFRSMMKIFISDSRSIA